MPTSPQGLLALSLARRILLLRSLTLPSFLLMPRVVKATSLTPKDSTANLGFETDFGPEHADTFRRDLQFGCT